MGKLSVVINTLNEEKNLPHAIASIKSLADEIVVVDMKSEDATQEIAKKAGARVYEFKKAGYVEPARNYAISKATSDWILILDADESVPSTLAKKIKDLLKNPKADYYRIPRKNIIFGKWIKHSRWWPDYNIRLFKKGKVTWNEVIHSVPMTTGEGADIPEKEDFAMVHNNYESLEQYMERMNKYSSIQAKLLIDKNYKFIWKDLISKPLAEFLSRYFAGEGYKDGLHGLALALLQSFSEAMVYLKVWQEEKFLEQTISPEEIAREFGDAQGQLNWWLTETMIKSKNFVASLPLRVRKRLLSKNE